MLLSEQQTASWRQRVAALNQFPELVVSQLTRITCSVLVVVLFANPAFALAMGQASDQPVGMSAAAAEASRILGVSGDIELIRDLHAQLKQVDSESVRTELLAHKCKVLRKILVGYLEVRQTSDQIDVDLGYTYDAIAKGSRRRDRLVQMCNVANFTQFGVQFSLAAAYRLHGDGFMSNLLTCTSGGATLAISSLGLLAGKAGKSREKHPPNMLADFFELNPPMQYQLPEMLKAFINSRYPGLQLTRREFEITQWKKFYHLDDSKQKKLTAIADSGSNAHGESLALLSNRLVLLYALNSLVEDFDSDLIALLHYMEDSEPVPVTISDEESVRTIGYLTPGAADAAKLLDIEKQVAELIVIRKTNGNRIATHQQLRLETLLLEKILGGALEVRKAVDRVDREKHYQIDVVMAELTGRRDRFMHKCDVANFMQTGILKSIAGICFFNGQPNAGGDLLEVVTSFNVILASASLAASRGGKRKIDSVPNSLAQFVNLSPPREYRLSALMERFIDSPPPQGSAGPNSTEESSLSVNNTGASRKQLLIERWKEHGIVPEKNRPTVMARLAYMPSERDQKVDTIKLASARLRMLFDVRTEMESFDDELLALLRSADANPLVVADETSLPLLHEATNNLQKKKGMDEFVSVDAIGERLFLTRRILINSLEVRNAVDQIDQELVTEYTVQGEMIAKMNKRIEITNAVNFLQSGITGLVGGGLGYVNNHAAQCAGNGMNIASGSAVIVLALFSMWQARGGKRPYKAKPNMLGPVFDLKDSPEYTRFSSLVWEQLNAPATGNFADNSISRREWLLRHWKKDGVLTVDSTNPQTLQKLAAVGPAYTPKSENLNLIKNRIYMLSELRTQVETFDAELLAMIHSID
ncbi:MAG TPA: hypothetical protein V6C89_08645 [Drouetiella sp.]